MGDSIPLSRRFVALPAWGGMATTPHQWHRPWPRPPEPSPRPPLGRHQLLGCGVGRGGRWGPSPGDPVFPDFTYKTQLKDRIINNFKMVTKGGGESRGPCGTALVVHSGSGLEVTVQIKKGCNETKENRHKRSSS